MAAASTGNQPRRSRRRRWIAAAALIAALFIGVSALYAYVYFNIGIGLSGAHKGAFASKPFDRGVWLAYANNWQRDNPRGPMAEDLRRMLLEQRPARAAVIALLGPDESSAIYPAKAPDDRLLAYNLGMWSRSRMDYDSLDILFNEAGQVSEIKIVPH
jgi:hypothetical protein